MNLNNHLCFRAFQFTSGTTGNGIGLGHHWLAQQLVEQGSWPDCESRVTDPVQRVCCWLAAVN
ncbi:MAG: hypothetical protein AAF329_19545 [Cyanobacteria bacterium P01_A01_bin.17]